MIDISAVLKHSLPPSDTLIKIQQFAKEHCPIRYFGVVLITHDTKPFKEKGWFGATNTEEKNIRNELIQEIYKLTFGKNMECNTIDAIHYQTEATYLRVRDRLKLYLVY